VTTLFVSGCGLLGTSVARAYRRLHPDALIVGIETDSSAREVATSLGVYSELVSSVKEAQEFGRATVGVAATPPACLAESLLALAPLCQLVMDVGSIKNPVIRELQHASAATDGVPSHIVPCHPMAGSQERGPAAGNMDLFTDRWVFVVPMESSDTEKVQCANEFWRSLGAQTQEIDAAFHDQAVAYSSHLPHLLSSAYMEVETPLSAAAGSGFMGFTRLARANPEMWSQVLVANRQAWQPLLRRYIEVLEQVDALVEGDDVDAVRKWLDGRRDERIAAEESGLNK